MINNIADNPNLIGVYTPTTKFLIDRDSLIRELNKDYVQDLQRYNFRGVEELIEAGWTHLWITFLLSDRRFIMYGVAYNNPQYNPQIVDPQTPSPPEDFILFYPVREGQYLIENWINKVPRPGQVDQPDQDIGEEAEDDW
jgi:hypothetical protein